MVFDLREVLDSTALPPFEVITPRGETVALPNVNQLTLRQAMRIQQGDLDALRQVAPDAADLLLDLPAHALNRLLAAWLEHGQQHGNGDGNGELGNPERSSPRGRRTAGTSQRT